MRSFVLLFVPFLACRPLGDTRLAGSKNVARSENVAVSKNVVELEIQGALSVQVLTGPTLEPRLESSAPLSFEERHGVLQLAEAEEHPHSSVTVVLNGLRRVEAKDGARVSVQSLRGGKTVLTARDDAHLVVTTVDVDTLEIRASTNTTVNVGGRARVATFEASDVATIEASALTAGVVRLRAEALSTISTQATEVLRATVRGSSRLETVGVVPRRLISSDTSSSVEQLEEPHDLRALRRNRHSGGVGSP